MDDLIPLLLFALVAFIILIYWLWWMTTMEKHAKLSSKYLASIDESLKKMTESVPVKNQD